MNKEICILIYFSNAANYGVGTFKNELVYCLNSWGYKINMVELGTNENISDFQIKEEGNKRTFSFPRLQKGDFEKYNKGVFRVLRLYIQDSDNLIFHIQTSQMTNLVDIIKTNFPLAKTIYTMHHLLWIEHLQGDVAL